VGDAKPKPVASTKPAAATAAAAAATVPPPPRQDSGSDVDTDPFFDDLVKKDTTLWVFN